MRTKRHAIGQAERGRERQAAGVQGTEYTSNITEMCFTNSKLAAHLRPPATLPKSSNVVAAELRAGPCRNQLSPFPSTFPSTFPSPFLSTFPSTFLSPPPPPPSSATASQLLPTRSCSATAAALLPARTCSVLSFSSCGGLGNVQAAGSDGTWPGAVVAPHDASAECSFDAPETMCHANAYLVLPTHHFPSIAFNSYIDVHRRHAHSRSNH